MRALLLIFISLTAEAQTWRARGVNGGGFFGPAQGGRAMVSGRVRQPQGSSSAFFEFAPASGAGVPAALTLCAAAAPYLSGKDVSWCTNGDGTAASGTTMSVATEQGTVTETTQQVCPNGLDCSTTPVMRPTTALSGYTEAANVDRSASVTTGSFTACNAYITQSNTGAVVINSALSQNNSSTWKYLLGNAASNPTFTRATVSTAACGAGASPLLGTIALEDGALTVSCITWNASDGIYRLYTNGAVDTVSAAFTTICGGGGTSRHGVSGFWTGATMENAPTTGGVLGAFYVDTTTGNGGQLSAGQILALSNAVLARGPTGTRGEALTFTRATARACESSTGLGSVVPTNVPCMAKNGYNGWPVGTIISARSNELENPYWTATAAVTANQARSFDGTLSADELNDSSGAAQQGVSVTIASTSATLHTFSCFVSSGTASSYSIGFTGTGSATGDATVNGTGLTSTGSWVSATSPAAYAGTLTAVTPFIRVGDTVGVTGTIFVSYCNHTTTAPSRSPAIRTVAAGATRATESGLIATLSTAIGPTACIAASMQFDQAASWAALQTAVSFGPTTGTPSMTIGKQTATTAYYEIVAGGPTTTNPAISAAGTAVHRAYLADNAGARSAFWDQGSVAAPASSMTAPQTRFVIGEYSVAATNRPPAGTVSRVQVDSAVARCTP